MKKIFSFLLLSFYFSIIIGNYGFISAQENKTIIINEIMWQGSSLSSADEWLELRNLTDKEIDLSGWIISGAATSGADLIIPQGKKISPSSYFLIANYSKFSNKSILDVEPDWVTTAVTLSNNLLKVELKDSVGNSIDVAGNGKKPLAGINKTDYKASMERVLVSGDGTKSYDWQTAIIGSNLKDFEKNIATPKSPNSSETEISSIKEAKNRINEVKISGLVTSGPNKLFENCIYIQDESGGLRIRLTNDSWPENIKIGSKLIIRGQVTTYYGEKEIKIPDISESQIKENEEPVFFNIKTAEFSDYEGALVKIKGKIIETSGDTFYVDDDSGPIKIYVKDSLGINLPKKKTGDWAEISGIISSWNGSFRLLPQKDSDILIIPQLKEAPIYNLPISEIKKLPKGYLIITRGIVSVLPKILANTYFYIQDESSGIQIYCWYKNYPQLKVGDYIEVFGELSQIYGEKRVKIKGAQDIRIIEYRGPPLAAKINIKDISAYQGRLVTVKGRIVKTSGKTFYISDGTGTIRIYITKLTGIKKPRTYKNDLVEITGIVSLSKTGLRVLPRYQPDFKLLWTKPKKPKKIARASSWRKIDFKEPYLVFEAKKEKSNNPYFYLGLILIIISSAFLIYLYGLKSKKDYEDHNL